MYESKLQELQKQVETISLVAETPDEEELDEEEEEEGMFTASPDMSLLLVKKSDNTLCFSLSVQSSNNHCVRKRSFFLDNNVKQS